MNIEFQEIPPMAILDRITVNLNLDKVRKKLHMKPDSNLNQVRSLVDMVQQLIEPKVIYNVSYIDEKLEDSVIVGGLTFKSGVLRKNLDRVERIFPYVITLGSKLDEKQNACDDILEKYYLDTIGNLALTSIQKQVKKHNFKNIFTHLSILYFISKNKQTSSIAIIA